MARYYIIWVNRTVTDQYHPIFECACAAEFLVMLFFVAFSPVFYESVIKARVLHVNIRIMAIMMHFHYCVSLLCRIVLVAYQHFAIPLRDDDFFLGLCVVFRHLIIPYICVSFGAIGLERIIGTYFGMWYERRGRGTLAVVIPIITANYLIALAASSGEYFIVYDLNMNVLLAALLFGMSVFLCFVLVSYTKKEVLCLEKFGSSYSINRRFQTLTALIRPIIILTIAMFGLFAVYMFTPAEWGFIHFFSVALYDVSVGVYANVLFIMFLSRQPTFVYTAIETARRSTMGRIMLNLLGLQQKTKYQFRAMENPASVTLLAPAHETDVYFNMFQKQIA